VVAGGIGMISNIVITNSTFSDNKAIMFNGGGLIVNHDSSVSVTNCIFWNNSDAWGTREFAQIDFLPGASVDVNYSCIHQWSGIYGGTGNFGYDPLFIVPEYGKTYAELGQEKKNQISHRADALRKIREIIKPFVEKKKT